MHACHSYPDLDVRILVEASTSPPTVVDSISSPHLRAIISARTKSIYHNPDRHHHHHHHHKRTYPAIFHADLFTPIADPPGDLTVPFRPETIIQLHSKNVLLV
ncbi:hypothetical protein SODALDRAFT_27009 [Sodiomyces alkalinus F11]|uniref:Uncharacterized protein n=1 Tax=Sodiomyces alkalinus (strain CBS 110278 / VKM F-3762 / F11) TaxID=1314773 RepID=A0A3N2Q884_SODAK|nr:hypothetical protein SODALDRAFT_27009 [Sodiomyces alkalinus F11]ROT42936.1 hypothetical protein SODALDRAFT_27009 [Sodiomyces alkalinus F11]